MKIFIKIIIILFCLTFIFSCKKEPSPDLIENPNEATFYIKGLLGSDSIHISATNNYYMYSSFLYDSARELFIFKGNLKQVNCGSSCDTAITIMVNNYLISPNQVINFPYDSAFKTVDLKWMDASYPNDYLGKAELIMNYNNGEPLRSSYDVSQPSNFLRIMNYDYFGKNEQNLNTVKVKVEGSVYLPTDTSPKLFTFIGQFAFAFPMN